MRSLSVTALLQDATFVEDAYEATRVWVDGAAFDATLTPVTLEQVQRLGLSPDDATHSLVTGNGLAARPSDTRVIVDARVYEVVRVTNLPHRTVLTLRSTSEEVGS